MLTKLRNYSVLNSVIKKINLSTILDIFIFGSAIKGKYKPKDIDICIIFKEKINTDLIKIINKEFEKLNINTHISFLTADNFFKKPHALIRTLLFEGISLITKKPLAKIYGLNSWVLYNYNLSGLKSSNKVRFVYTLKGRKKENGLIKDLKGVFLSPGSFIVPINKDKEVVELLNTWKVKYQRKKIMLMD